jgi:deazaflavin-dependent oxidoreductase (nitroreductase family)
MNRITARIRLVLAAFFSKVMRTRAAQRYVAPLVPPLQMRLYRWTRGRVNLSAIVVPSLVLETTGAKTGQARQTPLMCWPERDGSWLVAGSNWGQPHHPAWTTNLLAHPQAHVVFARRRRPVRAVLLDGAEREAAWPVLEAQWPGYRSYEQTAGRELRIFRLVPAA